LPVPVEEPLYIPEESESDESIVEEETVEEFPGITLASFIHSEL